MYSIETSQLLSIIYRHHSWSFKNGDLISFFFNQGNVVACWNKWILLLECRQNGRSGSLWCLRLTRGGPDSVMVSGYRFCFVGKDSYI